MSVVSKIGSAGLAMMSVLLLSVAPAGADFHAYAHADYVAEVTRVPGYVSWIDVPDNVVSSVHNWTDTCWSGRDETSWVTSIEVIRIHPNDHKANLWGASDRIDFFSRC